MEDRLADRGRSRIGRHLLLALAWVSSFACQPADSTAIKTAEAATAAPAQDASPILQQEPIVPPPASQDPAHPAATALLQEARELAEDHQPLAAARLYEEALGAALAAGDRQTEADARLGLGSSLSFDYPGRFSHLRLAAEIYREIDHRAGEAATFEAQGAVFRERNFNAQALEPLEQAVHLWQQTDDRPSEVRARIALADVHDVLGSYEKALMELEDAVALLPSDGLSLQSAMTRYRLGLLNAALGLEASAIDQFQAALPILEALDDGLADAAFNGGEASDEDLAAGAQYLKRLVEVMARERAKLPDEPVLAQGPAAFEAVRNEVSGELLQVVGEVDDGLDFEQDPSLYRSLELEKEVARRRALPYPEDDDERIAFFGKIKVLEKELFRLDHARMQRGGRSLRSQREGLAAGRRGLTSVMPAEQLAEMQSTLQIMATAMSEAREEINEPFRDALKHQEPLCALVLRTEVLNALGNAYQEFGRPERARPQYSKAWDLVEQRWQQRPASPSPGANGDAEGVHREDEVRQAMRQGLLSYREDHRQKTNAFQELRHPDVPAPPAGLARGCGQETPWLSSWNLRSLRPRPLWQADAYLANNRLREAFDTYQSFVAGSDPDRWIAETRAVARRGMGDIQLEWGQNDEALAQYLAAIDILEGVQADLRLDRLTSSFADSQSSLYARAIRLAARLGQDSLAFELAERGRGRSFLNQLGNRKLPASHVPADLAEREQELRQRRIELQNILRQKRADFEATDFEATPQAPAIRKALETVRQDHERTLERIRQNHPRYADLVSVEPVALEQLQRRVLTPGVSLIEYFVLDDQTLAWVIEWDQFSLVKLDISAAELRQQTRQLRDGIANRSFDHSVAGSLYAHLIQPLEPSIRHDRLIIVAHDALHYLPFAALWNADRAQYLIERFTLALAPSASALPYLAEQKTSSKGRILALGDPDSSLPGARREVQAIAEIFGSQAHVGAAASEQLVHQTASEFDVLHLAAHGVYAPNAPFTSRLELAGDPASAVADSTSDGDLEVHEIYGLDLRETDLVVLSACQSGLGPSSRGDEVIGMTRAFLHAGVPLVITTLWSIDDAASGLLMTRFYRHFQMDGLSPAIALRRAQIEMLAEDPWSSPYHWASFVPTGIL